MEQKDYLLEVDNLVKYFPIKTGGREWMREEYLREDHSAAAGEDFRRCENRWKGHLLTQQGRAAQIPPKGTDCFPGSVFQPFSASFRR